MTVTIFGSGTSTGVPIPGCHCEVCQSSNEKDKRTRTSILIQNNLGKNVLVDTGPDLRFQLLANQISKIDGAIITHDHADHVHGIDDLRPLCWHNENRSIPIYTDKATAKSLTKRFPYIFQANKIFTKKRPLVGGGIPHLNLQVVPVSTEKKTVTTSICEMPITFFQVPHAYTKTLCFICGKLGFITDCQILPNYVLNAFKAAQLDLLIIDCLQLKEKKRPTHLRFDQSLEYIDLIKPKRAGLIHISHFMGHEELLKLCQSATEQEVFPLYDGQQFLL